MINSPLVLKIKTLWKEYNEYEEYLNEFTESIEEEKKGLASKINDPDFDKEVERFCLDFFVLKLNYRRDIEILTDKIITYFQAAQLQELDKEVPEDIKKFVKTSKEKALQPHFFMRAGKPTEVKDGYVEELKTSLKEQGNLDKLIATIKNQ